MVRKKANFKPITGFLIEFGTKLAREEENKEKNGKKIEKIFFSFPRNSVGVQMIWKKKLLF